MSDQDEVEEARVARARAVGMFRYRLIRDAAAAFNRVLALPAPT